ncbi:MAG TPA: outer membrane lipoprotein-sorting protein [Myxococcota bacterium]|jgi:hypothetical protein
MLRRLLGEGVVVLALSSILSAHAAGEAEGDRSAAADRVLERAFHNRYEVDTREYIEVVVRSPESELSRRRLVVATKRIDGRLHSLGRFLAPEYLRGMTILSIENARGSGDHFVYLREVAKLRRISIGHRADAFMGTDLTYEDFERRRVSHYRAELRPASALSGEPVDVISALPRYPSGYARVEFWIARSDAAILETRYFKQAAGSPYKVIHAPRADTRQIGGHALPTRILVENLARGTQTEVRIEQLSVDPGLDDAIFTAAAVEVGRPIPGLER